MPGDNASANRHAKLRAHIRAVLHKLSTPTRPVRQQVAAELTRRHIPTPRPGGAWSATQVTRILNRVGV